MSTVIKSLSITVCYIQLKKDSDWSIAVRIKANHNTNDVVIDLNGVIKGEIWDIKDSPSKGAFELYDLDKIIEQLAYFKNQTAELADELADIYN